jgi:hypothetical protein
MKKFSISIPYQEKVYGNVHCEIGAKSEKEALTLLKKWLEGATGIRGTVSIDDYYHEQEGVSDYVEFPDQAQIKEVTE